MADPVDQEIEAIRLVLSALSPLSEKARLSVLAYVARRLELNLETHDKGDKRTNLGGDEESLSDEQPIHLKDFRNQKKPRSANEMAALVAYFLRELAPSTERKSTINQKDIETYFKIGDFPLPEQPRVTLPNARAAGYFDSAGEGEYKLNPVGHNLVAHSMPRGAGKRRKTSKRTTTRKVSVKRKKT